MLLFSERERGERHFRLPEEHKQACEEGVVKDEFGDSKHLRVAEEHSGRWELVENEAPRRPGWDQMMEDLKYHVESFSAPAPSGLLACFFHSFL